MKLKQFLEQLNQLAKERPEALEMEIVYDLFGDSVFQDSVGINGISLKEGKIMLGVEVQVLKSITIE